MNNQGRSINLVVSFQLLNMAFKIGVIPFGF